MGGNGIGFVLTMVRVNNAISRAVSVSLTYCGDRKTTSKKVNSIAVN